jgi:hypothetical protein
MGAGLPLNTQFRGKVPECVAFYMRNVGVESLLSECAEEKNAILRDAAADLAVALTPPNILRDPNFIRAAINDHSELLEREFSVYVAGLEHVAKELARDIPLPAISNNPLILREEIKRAGASGRYRYARNCEHLLANLPRAGTTRAWGK